MAESVLTSILGHEARPKEEKKLATFTLASHNPRRIKKLAAKVKISFKKDEEKSKSGSRRLSFK